MLRPSSVVRILPSCAIHGSTNLAIRSTNRAPNTQPTTIQTRSFHSTKHIAQHGYGGGGGGGGDPNQQPGQSWVNPANVPAGEALKKYCHDLTQMARDGKLDPVIGRDSETRRAIEILSRRTKNNPVLLGEPGVGEW